MITFTLKPEGDRRLPDSSVELGDDVGQGSILCKELSDDLRIVFWDCTVRSATSLLNDLCYNYEGNSYSLFLFLDMSHVRLKDLDGLRKSDKLLNACFLSSESHSQLLYATGQPLSGISLNFTATWLRNFLIRHSHLKLSKRLLEPEQVFELFSASIEDIKLLMNAIDWRNGEMHTDASLIMQVERQLEKFMDHCYFTQISFSQTTIKESLLRLKQSITLYLPRQEKIIQDIAAEMGIPSPTLCSYFKRYFGISLGRFCMDSKMKHARERIEQEPVNFDTLARDLGFENRSAFSKLFKDYFGYTPTDYRQRFSRAEGNSRFRH